MKVKVRMVESLRFMVDCLKAAGANANAAEHQAIMLTEADRRGHHSHGLNRLKKDLNDIVSGACTPNKEPKLLKETVSTAWIDANHVMGATSSLFAMDIAIAKAKYSGIGWVVVKHANHNGLMSHWARKAADQNLIGWCFSNSPPLIAPTRAKKAALGTNPLSLVAPATGGEMFLLDISTSAVSLGKIEMKHMEGEKIPSGWALGPDGKETTDAAEGRNTVTTCDHTTWPVECPPEDRGHCFAVIDTKRFAPGFGDRLAECINYWRTLDPIDPKLPVKAPGDLEREAAEKTDETGLIVYPARMIDSTEVYASRFKVKPIEVHTEAEQRA